MTIKHDNPTKKRKGGDWARAPYNFVPLPQKMVPAPTPDDLPGHDSYHNKDQNLLTGWIECELETLSPTYIRGMATKDLFERIEKKLGQGKDLTPKEKEETAPFFATTKRILDGYPQPAIPGSSLRGMIRNLVEVIGFGRMRYVDAKPTFTFRAVAASKDDPLRDPYRNVVGAFGRNVKAGYLEKNSKGKWCIQPALTPADMGWPDKSSAYIKVKERQIGSKNILGFLRFNSPNYKPQLHPVSFNVRIGRGKRGSYISLSQIGASGVYKHEGVLVCSGNMLETGKPGQKSPRKNHALVLRKSSSARIEIDDASVEDYKKGLTPFQRDELGAWSKNNGCLKEGNPVFYVTDGNRVVQFGHCPNFRVTARQNWFGKDRASTPLDFVPGGLRTKPEPDFADAIFGWVEEKVDGKIIGPEKQRAGRVFFSDAQFVEFGEDGVWFKPDPITPHVLTGPKPTTFQHYLVQNRSKGHDPDKKVSLAHYGTSSDETQVRGHKFYWFKGAKPDIEATAAERVHESQLTRIVPLKPGVRFNFKIHFENLREEELGVLWWALTLPGDTDKNYCHHIGMGKPLGMGAVKLTPQLHLTDRQERYGQLFSGNEWQIGETEAEPAGYVQAFEDYLRDHDILVEGQPLADLERIQALLTMMEWEEKPDSRWMDLTRYMEIERGTRKINEYKERPVLPTPQVVRELAGDPDYRPARNRISKPPPGYVHGSVKLFGLGSGKTYGFIQPDGGGGDIFVHINQLSSGLEWLEAGQRVVFKIGPGLKGPAALDVRLED